MTESRRETPALRERDCLDWGAVGEVTLRNRVMINSGILGYSTSAKVRWTMRSGSGIPLDMCSAVRTARDGN
jgi:hypothetical protein